MLRITDFCIKKQGDNDVIKRTLRRASPLRATRYSHFDLKNVSVTAPARMTTPQNQTGGAIVWILVMVAVFAALNFVITQGSRSGGATISKEQAALAATEILQYGEAIKRAVQTLQINGCSDTEISFENNVVAGYENPNAPADKSCHVFDIAGGGMNYLDLRKDWLVYNVDYWFNGETSISGIGSVEPELMMWAVALKIDICHAIENKINGRDASTETVSTHTVADGFIGTYTTALTDNIGDYTGGLYENKMSGCILNAGVHPSAFYQVLIVR